MLELVQSWMMDPSTRIAVEIQTGWRRLWRIWLFLWIELDWMQLQTFPLRWYLEVIRRMEWTQPRLQLQSRIIIHTPLLQVRTLPATRLRNTILNWESNLQLTIIQVLLDRFPLQLLQLHLLQLLRLRSPNLCLLYLWQELFLNSNIRLKINCLIALQSIYREWQEWKVRVMDMELGLEVNQIFNQKWPAYQI